MDTNANLIDPAVAVNVDEPQSVTIAFMKALFYKSIYGGGVVFDLAKWLIVILVVLIILNTFFFSIFIVSGVSMSPTFKDKDLIFWNKNIYDKTEPRRGDIIVMNYPGDPTHKTYVKRIIGLSGEKVEINKGKIFINDKQLDESYISFDVTTDPDGNWTLKPGQYFVMGDNRSNSNDSRFFGPIEKRFILGKSVVRLYPDFRLTEDM